MDMDFLLTAVGAAAKWLGIIMLFVMPVASLLTWAERRQSAMMQDRVGPNRANIGPIKIWGILHFVADAVKMINKEDVIPARAHRVLFALSPILAVAPVLIAFAIIPFGPTVHYTSLFSVLDPNALPEKGFALQVFQSEFGILFYFAVASLSAYGATLAGWASYNKWALLGGLRASSQMISYEVTMGLAVLGMLLVTGTLEPGAIASWQGSNPLHWGIVVQPVAFLLFFTAALAETKRTPFDLPEGEPEIIGYFTEFSGMRFGLFFLGEFIEIVFLSALMVTIFFGGYHLPFVHVDGLHFFGWHLELPHLLVVLIQVVGWTVKVIFFCWFQLLIRWTLPRFRPDQLMDLGWKKLLPASIANTMATAVVLVWMREKR